MKLMTREAWRAFLLDGTRTAKLAMVRTGGRPHQSGAVAMLVSSA